GRSARRAPDVPSSRRRRRSLDWECSRRLRSPCRARPPVSDFVSVRTVREGPCPFSKIPISNRAYDTYRRTVKVRKDMSDGQSEGRPAKKNRKRSPPPPRGLRFGQTPD